MYEELVKRLRSAESNYQETLDCLSEAADAIEHMQKTILRLENELGIYDDLPMVDQFMVLSKTEKTTQWIPVTERLPETPGEYMVAYHPCYWDRVHDEIKVGLDSFRGKTSWAKKKYQRVTHWMPLPEPPKEE